MTARRETLRGAASTQFPNRAVPIASSFGRESENMAHVFAMLEPFQTGRPPVMLSRLMSGREYCHIFGQLAVAEFLCCDEVTKMRGIWDDSILLPGLYNSPRTPYQEAVLRLSGG
jgi:hypothetical protein